MQNRTKYLGRRSAVELLQRLVVCAVLTSSVGCGKSAVPEVHWAGAVTINGAAVPADAQAAMSFAPLAGGEAVSVPIVNGRYDSPTTPAGSVKVTFYITRPVGPERVSERTGEKFRDIANLVPAERVAGIVVEVSGDDLNRDFKL